GRGGRADFADRDGQPREGRYSFGFTVLRGAQGQGAIAQRQGRFPGGLRAATRDVQEDLGRHDLGRDRVPHIPLRRVDAAIPRGAYQQIDARRAGSHKDVIHIGFPTACAYHVGRGTAVARRVDGVETVEPLVTFL